MWTAERIEALKKMWAGGLSGSQIAEDLGGLSRNAVLGKLNRLGLSGRVKINPPKRKRTPAEQPHVRRAPAPPPSPSRPTADVKPTSRVSATVPTVCAVAVAPPPAAIASPPPAGGVHLFDLRAEQCRRPLFDDPRPETEALRFCGAATVDAKHNYCPACEPRMLNRVSAKAAQRHFDRVAAEPKLGAGA